MYRFYGDTSHTAYGPVVGAETTHTCKDLDYVTNVQVIFIVTFIHLLKKFRLTYFKRHM